MLEQRDLKLDLLALGLLALSVFLAVSLLSYDPGDPPGKLVYPEPSETANVCGRYGAVVSAVLLEALGLGAYYLVFSLAVLDSFLLARRPITEPVLRSLGWLLSLVGFSTLAAMALAGCSPGPVIGSGGYLGATGRGLLEMNFASVGAYIFVTSLILGGLLLSTDYVLVRLLVWCIGLPSRNLGRGFLWVTAAYAEKLAKTPADADSDEENEEDEYEEEEEEEELDSSVVRVRGPQKRDETEDGEQDEQEEQPDCQSETDDSSRQKRRPFLPLRIRKPKKTQREEVMEQIEAADSADPADYELPSLDLLLENEPFSFDEHEREVRRKAKVLEKTFADFGFRVRVVEIQTGPVVAQFEVDLEAGLRLSRITGLADDLAIALRVPSVRIVAPIPGKNTVGVEVPNTQRQLVRIREVMEEADGTVHSQRIPIYLGKDVSGNPMLVDLASLPHLLIAGRTGTGKSVCLNSIIVSILMSRRPDEVRMLLIDPKMVELSPYKQIPHLMHPVVTDMRKAEAILAWAVEKMEERYHLLARAGVRHLSVYNQLGEEELMQRIDPDEEERDQIPRQMPFIVIVADEMADLMMTAAKEVEAHIIRLAQKSRAVGIHLVLATQKPTVDVITGLIKSNLPARICFEVASRTDSRVVLDEMGADKLLGDGDMLFLRPGTSALIRGQGTYVSDDEIARVIDSVATTEPQFFPELVELRTTDREPGGQTLSNRDELYEAAIDVVVREGRGSVSLLQRTLGIGYGRAARLIDYMAEDGIVGPYNGSQAREVLIALEEWNRQQGQAAEEEPSPSRKRANNKILLPPPSKEVSSKPTRTPPLKAVSHHEEAPEDEYSDELPSHDTDEDEFDEEASNETSEPAEYDEEDSEDHEDYDDEVEEDDCQDEEEENWSEEEEDWDDDGDEEYDEGECDYEDEDGEDWAAESA